MRKKTNRFGAWSKEELTELYKLRHEQNQTYFTIEKILRKKKISTKSHNAFKQKYTRMDWQAFNKKKNKRLYRGKFTKNKPKI